MKQGAEPGVAKARKDDFYHEEQWKEPLEDDGY